MVKFRRHQWFDTMEMVAMYGIQAKIAPKGRWLHCSEDGRPLLFKDEEDRDHKMRVMSRLARTDDIKFSVLPTAPRMASRK